MHVCMFEVPLTVTTMDVFLCSPCDVQASLHVQSNLSSEGSPYKQVTLI